MITDKIKNIDLYTNIPLEIREYIKTLTNLASAGRHELSAGNYINLESYQTKPLNNAKYEAHQKYADIQLLISGKEKIYYKDKEHLTTDIEYNSEKDIEFFKEDVNGNFIELDGTNFVVLYPHEAHAPQVSVDNDKQTVFKAVAKVKL